MTTIREWPRCTHCKQDCTGSYVGVPKCHRCFARVRVVTYVEPLPQLPVTRPARREDR